MKIHGILLAAGFGKRLMPLTARIPKPLLPVCGTPMLKLALDALAKAGVSKVAVNAHHLSEQIERFVKSQKPAPELEFFFEPEILGTGGPLVNAKAMLSDCDCFLLHNGDILSDFDLKELLKLHLDSGAVATMAALDGPENRLLVSDGKVVDILGRLGTKAAPGSSMLTYAGIAAFSPEIFEFLPEKPMFCSLIDAILKAIASRPGAVSAFAPPKPFWSDIGSFEQYFKAHEELLLKKGGKGPFHFAAGCKISPKARLSGFVSASEGCVLEDGSSVGNCVLLPGVRMKAGECRRNEIAGPGFSAHRDQTALSALKVLERLGPWEATSLAEQGSDRRFYRIRRPNAPSMALMVSNKSDPDFGRFVDLGIFFRKFKLPTPDIYAFDPLQLSVLMEDLGDDTLYDLAHRGLPMEAVELHYMRVVEALAKFQASGSEALQKTGFKIRLFDVAYLRWESSYFMENFICGLCRLKPGEKALAAAGKELDALAESAFNLPRTLMHRDFQSQNILLPGGIPRFVDFQGARLGPYLYDIASLLKDPYVSLPRDLRDDLAERHWALLRDLHSPFKDLSFEHYLDDYRLASLQRNMQALGAYGFLPLKKGKLKYLAFAEPCLKLLAEGLEGVPAGTLDEVKSLCKEAEAALSSGIEAAKASSPGAV